MEKTFGKIRSFFWPVYRFELKKIVPMFFMFFLFNFIYYLLKDIKEPLMVTAAGSGVEAIPFLKMWGVLPLAFLFMFIYSKLSKRLSKQKLFYCIISTFVTFFAVFVFVLYPLKDFLHPNDFADKLQTILPSGFKGLIAIIRNWTFALFYSMSELWGSVAISFLFWGFSNDITSVKESKRFYALFGLGSSLAMLCSGPTIIYFSKVRDNLPSGVDPWGVSLFYLISIIIVAGILIMASFFWINKYLLTDERFYPEEDQKIRKKEKPKMCFKEAFSYLIKDRYLQLIALLVVGYTTCITFAEIVWKSQLKIMFPTPNQYSAFRGYFTSVTSVLSVIMLFVGGAIVRKFGWKKAALLTPLIIFITSIGFFGFVTFNSSLSSFVSFFNTTPLVMTIVFGTLLNGLGKTFKASLYEPTKEMAYIPLDPDVKTKGKAAIDVLVHKFSKAGGAFFLQGLIVLFGSILAIAPVVGVVVLLMLSLWVVGIFALNKRYMSLTDEKQSENEEILV